MQTRIESTSEGARRLDISCESTSLPGVTEPSTRPKPRLAFDKPNRPKCPDGHTVDISSAKWTTPNGTYTRCGSRAWRPRVHSLRLYELIGEQTMRLDLTPRQRFHATSAIVGFVVGIAADMGHELPDAVASGTMDRAEYLAAATAAWRALDAAEFPFIHHIVEEFAQHTDRAQFQAGFDLLLEGIRLQAGD